MAQMDKIKFQTNIPVTVKFKYNQPRENTHDEYGTSYAYGVNSEGVDKIFYATELLHTTLQAADAKQNKTVQIIKSEDPNDGRKKVWFVNDAEGKLLARSDNLPEQASAPQDAQNQLTTPDHSRSTQQQAQQQEPPPMDDVPPPEADYAPPQQAAPGPQQQFANNQRIKEEIATTMDQAYKMAKLIAKMHDVHPEHTSACAHSFFIELRKKNYRPTNHDINDTIARMKEQAKND